MSDETTCPKCGATLRPEDAAWVAGPIGYAPALLWAHPRPDGKGKCRMRSGPPLAYAPARPRGSIDATTLSAGQAPPERQ